MSWTIERPVVETPVAAVTPLPALMVVLPALLPMLPFSSTSAAELIATVPWSWPLNSMLIGLSAFSVLVVIVLLPAVSVYVV